MNTFSRNFFKQHFLQSYLPLSKDRVASVRMEFANSLLKVKPFLESEQSLGNELMSILTSMQQDTDREVVEAVEACDYELLQMRKKSKEAEKALNAADAQRMQQESALLLREAKVRKELNLCGRRRKKGRSAMTRKKRLSSTSSRCSTKPRINMEG